MVGPPLAGLIVEYVYIYVRNQDNNMMALNTLHVLMSCSKTSKLVRGGFLHARTASGANKKKQAPEAKRNDERDSRFLQFFQLSLDKGPTRGSLFLCTP